MLGPFLLSQLISQGSNRAPCLWIDPIRGDLRKRLEDEQAFPEAGVRHAQPRLVDRICAVQNQIEVERARGARKRPLAASSALDLQEDVQEVARRERGRASRSAVEKRPLRPNPDGFGLVPAGDREIRELRPQPIDGKRKVGLPIADVGAERDRDLDLTQSSEWR